MKPALARSPRRGQPSAEQRAEEATESLGWSRGAESPAPEDDGDGLFGAIVNAR